SGSCTQQCQYSWACAGAATARPSASASGARREVAWRKGDMVALLVERVVPGGWRERLTLHPREAAAGTDTSSPLPPATPEARHPERSEGSAFVRPADPSLRSE